MNSTYKKSYRCWLLSGDFCIVKNEAFALAVANVLSGGDGAFRRGEVMDHMTRLISRGVPFNGPDGYEVGRWENRLSPEDGLFNKPISSDAYYAWVDPDLWDYDPHCVIYTKVEFMELFADCCRNYVAANPERREEFVQAMAANGMVL